MRIGFYKYHGTANDFILFDGRDFPLAEEELKRLTPALCDRHRGIGADGTILVVPLGSNGEDLKMVYFNADGSRAEMCGNGIRCLGKFAYDHGLVSKRELVVETPAGPHRLWLTVEGREVTQVRVEMGVPRLGPEAVGAVGLQSNDGPVAELVTGEGRRQLVLVSMGNPHAVSFEERLEDGLVHRVGAELEHHPSFPRGVNTEFVRLVSPDRLEVRVWERGVGETMACGTGACASAVAAITMGRATSPLRVALPGGEILIEWEGEGRPVHLTGPAVEVFQGEFDPVAFAAL